MTSSTVGHVHIELPTNESKTAHSAAKESPAYHVMTPDETLQKLQSNRSSGLTESETKERLGKYGENVLPSSPPKTVLERLWAQMNSILIYVLLAGAALSFGFEHHVDGIVIIAVILINVSVGYYMEGKAENTTQKLKEMMSPTAWVIRDSEKKEVESSNLTLGDIIFLQGGDIVPADGRILTCADLAVLEAALTGESHAVQKSVTPLADATKPLAERKCMVFAGTQVIKGSAVCVVTCTGAYCEVGKISSLLKEVKEQKTPLELKLEEFGVYLSVIILLLAVLALIVALLRGYSIAVAFSFAIGIAVAAIPEGLPSCVTITFAVGVQHMAKQRAIVKSLPAVETLGSVSVICSDKTGTLTQNCMTVKAIVTNTAVYKVGREI
ncbi:hypothetical protein EON65_13300 [archaeon]|nr:MAG: hypothetical protein EON65_13300 [archaeon]